MNTPDWYPHDDWAELSDEHRERAHAWHAMSAADRRLMVRSEFRLIVAHERALNEVNAEAMQAMVVDDVATEPVEPESVAEVEQLPDPPAGNPPSQPKSLSNAKWPFAVYDYLLTQPDHWVTAKEMMTALDARSAAVHSGLRVLRRQNLIVDGPLVPGQAGRRLNSYQLARV